MLQPVFQQKSKSGTFTSSAFSFNLKSNTMKNTSAKIVVLYDLCKRTESHAKKSAKKGQACKELFSMKISILM